MRGALIGAWWGVVSSLILAIDGTCEFPRQWSGRWFQSGVQNLININTTHIETKGECLEHDGDKFIIEDKLDNCFRCVVIHEKHPNVLQYKETYCDERQSLDAMCAQITGDAILFSMLRAESPHGPVKCPFSGPFTFTYNRGMGECSNPVSRIDSCTDESRLLLRYQACPDVSGTESTVEELLCLALWKEGSTRYLIGKLYHKMATSNEDRYRCFVYDHRQSNGHSTFNVAQSGDATCNGLLSATEGSRTMRLTKVETQHPRCHYPLWVTEHHQWHTLDYKSLYHFSHKNATLRITDKDNKGQEIRVVCHSIEVADNEHQVTLVAHLTSGCKSGYICMVFYRRDGHVIELQRSNDIVQAPEEACNPMIFHQATIPYTTLITTSLRPRKCPYRGQYTISGFSVNGKQVLRKKRKKRVTSRRKREEIEEEEICNSEHFESLVVGCSDKSDTMEFFTSCAKDRTAYSCHASWDDNGTSYLIASPLNRRSTDARRYCFVYTHGVAGSDSGSSSDSKRKRDTILQVSGVTESCHRNISPGVTGERAFNLSMDGHCAQASTGAVSTTVIMVPSVFCIIVLVIVISNLR
ncbi:uncharacterized protein [Anabrus simplex]|uniref:uncharacterized protein n=1 Tax=Anabrus simplex TaxID=316456 RepID=UPI0035A3AEAA